MFEKILQEWNNLIGQEVTFRKPIFEDDWQVEGSKGVVDSVRVVDDNMVCVYFDFSKHEAHNFPLMEKVYYNRTPGVLETAVESGYYKSHDRSYTDLSPDEYFYPNDRMESLKIKAKEMFPRADEDQVRNMVAFAIAAKPLV